MTEPVMDMKRAIDLAGLKYRMIWEQPLREKGFKTDLDSRGIFCPRGVWPEGPDYPELGHRRRGGMKERLN